MWFSIFLGRLAKRIFFTTSGVRRYRQLLPLCLGFIFGLFWLLVCGVCWVLSLIEMSTGYSLNSIRRMDGYIHLGPGVELFPCRIW